MNNTVPYNAPKSAAELSERIYAAVRPSTDDLRLMLLLEATGKGVYEDLARAVPDVQAATLLRMNGREETGHAHRIRKALKVLTQTNYEVPPLGDNPYYERRDYAEVTAGLLRSLAASELRGEALYNGWADRATSPEAARLFSLNADEEGVHAKRLQAAADILDQRRTSLNL